MSHAIVPATPPEDVIASGLLDVVRCGDYYAVVLDWQDPAEGPRRVPLMVLARDSRGLWFAARSPDKLGSVLGSPGFLTLHDAVSRQVSDYTSHEALASAITALVSTVRPAPAR